MRTLWLMVLLIAVGPVGVGYHYYRRANRENRAEITALLQSTMAQQSSKLRDFLVASHPRHQPGDFEELTLRKVKFKYALGENMTVNAKADVLADFSFKFHRTALRIEMAKEGPPPKVWNVKWFDLSQD